MIKVTVVLVIVAILFWILTQGVFNPSTQAFTACVKSLDAGLMANKNTAIEEQWEMKKVCEMNGAGVAAFNGCMESAKNSRFLASWVYSFMGVDKTVNKYNSIHKEQCAAF